MDQTAPDRLPPEFYQQPLTARMLGDFATCPRKFLLSFFTTDEEERRLRGGPATLHQAVRRALLDIYALGGPPAVTPEEVAERFAAHWEGRWCADAVEEMQLHRAGLEMLAAYRETHASDPARVVATDLRLTAQIGEQTYVAVADLVLAPEAGGTQVLRFVTSRQPASTAELRTELSAQLLWLLATTSLAAEGEPAPLVSFYALRQGRSREVALTPAEADHLRLDLASRAARMHRETAFDPRKGPYCRWCRSRPRCPLWRR